MTSPETLDHIRGGEQLAFSQAVEAFALIPPANFAPYEHLIGQYQRAEQRDMFIQGRIRNPRLYLPEESLAGFESDAHQLQRVLGIAGSNTTATPEQESAFYELAAERAAGVNFVRQVVRVGDMLMQDPRRPKQAAELQKMNNELYGLPDPMVFDSILADERQKALTVAREHSDPEMVMVAEDLLSLLPDAESQPGSLYRPTEATRVHYEEVAKSIFQPLVDHLQLDDRRVYSPTEMKDVFESALGFIQAEGWNAVMKDGGTGRSTNQQKKCIEVGTDSDPLNGFDLAMLAVHEVGIHVGLRIIGEKTDNPILWSKGMAFAETNEEGLVKVVTNCLGVKEQTKKPNGLYLCAGLSLGLDGRQRDFRDVFEVAWRRDLVDTALKSMTTPASMEDFNQARRNGYVAATRVKRGMPTDIPGMTFTKDIMYVDGEINVWKHLEERLYDAEDFFLWLMVGKHDMTRPDQMALVAKSQPKASHKTPEQPIIKEGELHE